MFFNHQFVDGVVAELRLNVSGLQDPELAKAELLNVAIDDLRTEGHSLIGSLEAVQEKGRSLSRADIKKARDDYDQRGLKWMQTACDIADQRHQLVAQIAAYFERRVQSVQQEHDNVWSEQRAVLASAGITPEQLPNAGDMGEEMALNHVNRTIRNTPKVRDAIANLEDAHARLENLKPIMEKSPHICPAIEVELRTFIGQLIS